MADEELVPNFRRVALLAVVVLYRIAPQDSPALVALNALSRERPIDLLAWDNSPRTHAPPQSFHGRFTGDAANPGLAAAYNAALEHAEATGAPWLMLMDQDTAVTTEYVNEVLERLSPDSPETLEPPIIGLLPRLLHHGRVVSPYKPRRWGPPGQQVEGKGPLQAFNSGAVLRVSAVRAMGGFDSTFPLDYLDHATFAGLQRMGGMLQILRSTLEHNLSTDTGVAATEGERVRQFSTLAAETHFYRLYGDWWDRLAHPFRLLRRTGSVLRHKRDWRSALQIVRAAFSACLPG